MTNKHEVHVKRETAELLKKAGFDWTVSYGYLPKSGLLTSGNFNNDGYTISVPTLDIAERWLREVKNYHIVLEYDMNIGYDGSELYDFEKIHAYILTTNNGKNICVYQTDNHKTHEEVKEAAIIKVLNILLDGENG